MQSFQIQLEDDSVAELEAAATKRGLSKQAYLEECVRKALSSTDDPILALIGFIKGGEPTEDIDEVIYGR